MTERELTQQAVDFLNAVLLPPAWYTLFPAGGGGRSWQRLCGLKLGVPDLLVICPPLQDDDLPPYDLPPSRRYTRLFGIELKTAKGRLSLAQITQHADMQEAGAIIFVARSVEQIADFLSRYRVPMRDFRIAGMTP
jgi:hypothetical protein